MLNMPRPTASNQVLVHPVSGRVLLESGAVLCDGACVAGLVRDGLGQVVILVSGGFRMKPQLWSKGRRFSL